jgi:hypothetical protein
MKLVNRTADIVIFDQVRSKIQTKEDINNIKANPIPVFSRLTQEREVAQAQTAHITKRLHDEHVEVLEHKCDLIAHRLEVKHLITSITKEITQLRLTMEKFDGYTRPKPL